MAKAQRAEVVVIGAGPGGYAAAFLAADLGKRVTLVDPEPDPGGVCLFRGCIPSKALLHAAKLIEDAREAADLGLCFAEPELDLPRLRAWKEGVVRKLTGGLGQLARQRKVDYLRGRARFDGAQRLAIETDAGPQQLDFENAILATGSRPSGVPGIELESPRLLDSTSALDLEDVPERLLVVGGGYIGLELGSVYAALGSRVSLVELTGSLLPGADPDLVRPLARRLEKSLDSIRLETRVSEVSKGRGALRVRFEGAAGSDEDRFDRVLVAVGRRPNSEDLGLESTRVRLDARGFVEVDAQRRSAEPSIFAIGDVAGEPMLAHKASHEGRLAARVIAGSKEVFEPRAIPAVVFTDPEIAWCGLTELEARAAGREVKVGRFPWAASGRAATLGRAEGLSKLVTDPDTGRLLGAGITGPGAGDLIAEAVLAIEMGATAADLALTIHPHPTLSETLMEAGESLEGTSTHIFRARS